ncbi:MAG TPA: PIN domain-containing protein [Thermoplasmata archaeon]|nr:PIN domain-containing protein [Thermoplasmata archaeon]
MRCLDATYLIDYLEGQAAAVAKVQQWTAASERLATPAPAAAETLLGAYYEGGSALRDALGLMETLEVLPIDATVATEAAQLGAEQLRRGTAASTVDLLIAAAARLHGGILVTRDTGFGRITGLAVETY